MTTTSQLPGTVASYLPSCRACRVGQALLRGQWQEAIRLILTPSERSKPEVLAACNAFLEEGDVGKALQLMPHHLVAERAVLQVNTDKGQWGG